MNTKVLMFGWEFPPQMSGGLGTACYGLTRAMTERGFDITFVMPKKAPVSASWMRFRFPGATSSSAQIRIRTFRSTFVSPYATSTTDIAEQLSGKKKNATGWIAHDFISEVHRYALFGAEIVKEEEYDVIYAHDWLSLGAGVAAKNASGKPLIVQIHSTEFDRAGGGESGINREIYDIERAGMEAADRIIAVSGFTKEMIVRHYGISPEKITVVYNGIDSRDQLIQTASHKIAAFKDAGYKIVLFLGRLTIQKGPEYFLRAAKKALEHQKDIMFVVTGNGDMEQQMKHLAGELGISDKVCFTGFIVGAERFAVFALADLYVMPSVSEPFGIVALEAIQMGTPVIISKQSGAAEVLQHALKVDFWDVDEMAHQIVSVTSLPVLGDALAGNAIREVNRLTWEAAAQKVEEVINSVLR